MASDSRGIDATCVLQIDSTMDPCSRTWRRAISVSIVSPDCDIATTSVRRGWGWAFTSEGAPFVAQRVCPMAAVAGASGYVPRFRRDWRAFRPSCAPLHAPCPKRRAPLPQSRTRGIPGVAIPEDTPEGACRTWPKHYLHIRRFRTWSHSLAQTPPSRQHRNPPCRTSTDISRLKLFSIPGIHQHGIVIYEIASITRLC